MLSGDVLMQKYTDEYKLNFPGEWSWERLKVRLVRGHSFGTSSYFETKASKPS